jgi:hypothetical protein
MTAIPMTPVPASVRQNSITVDVIFNGKTYALGVFDTWEGGNVTAESTKHRRGGMGIQVAIGGVPTIEDVTISRDYDLARDNPMAHLLSDAVGRANVVATKSYLDQDGNSKPGFRPIVIRGVLVGYNEPNADSDAADFAMFEIVVNPTGNVG